MIESQYRITILGVFYCNFATKLTPFNGKMLHTALGGMARIFEGEGGRIISTLFSSLFFSAELILKLIQKQERL